MLCVLLVFCSLVMAGNAPLYEGAVSRFDISYGNVYLAHNTEDGKYFQEVGVGDYIHQREGEGWTSYKVVEVIEAEALEPESETTALFIEGKWRSVYWVHDRIYSRPDSLILQTCIYRDGNLNWGRLFVIAERQE